MAENLEDINLGEALEPEDPSEFDSELATVSEVDGDGISLIFDGEDQSGGKKYKCNIFGRFLPGDRVSLKKQAGSYVVEYAIGTPRSRYPIPAGGTVGQVLAKASDQDYSLHWITPGGLPPESTSTYGKYLKSDRNGPLWAAVSGTLPAGGTAGQYLKKSTTTDYACSWATITEYDGPTIKGTGTTSIGFFGTTATTRKTVNKISTYGTADAGTNRTKINEIITALIAYGLINGY